MQLRAKLVILMGLGPWLSRKHYEAGEYDPHPLITLLRSDIYRDAYVGNDEWEYADVHGPYVASDITVEDYKEIGRETFVEDVGIWLAHNSVAVVTRGSL